MNNEIKEMKYQTNRKVELLYNNIYKNYHYYILNLGTHPTAYIEVTRHSHIYFQDYRELDINVHGGLTFSGNTLYLNEKNKITNSWFIGWDYAHTGDYVGYYEDFNNCGIFTINSLRDDKKWTTKEIIKECENVINQIIRKYDF